MSLNGERCTKLTSNLELPSSLAKMTKYGSCINIFWTAWEERGGIITRLKRKNEIINSFRSFLDFLDFERKIFLTYSSMCKTKRIAPKPKDDEISL